MTVPFIGSVPFGASDKTSSLRSRQAAFNQRLPWLSVARRFYKLKEVTAHES